MIGLLAALAAGTIASIVAQRYVQRLAGRPLVSDGHHWWSRCRLRRRRPDGRWTRWRHGQVRLDGDDALWRPVMRPERLVSAGATATIEENGERRVVRIAWSDGSAVEVDLWPAAAQDLYAAFSG